jgi:protein SCO1/2
VRQLRIILWAAVGVALIAAGYLLTRKQDAPAPAVQTTELVEVGGPFTLVGSDGRPFSSAQLNRKPYAIFFGFTHCPDVCPTTLARMVKLRQQLFAGERPFEILFVTVDPERDGPAEVGKYAELFDSPVTGLTGSPAQIDRVKKQFGIFSEKIEQPGGDYNVNHTSTVLLFDKKGEFSGTIAPEEQDTAALAKLKRISG